MAEESVVPDDTSSTETAEGMNDPNVSATVNTLINEGHGTHFILNFSLKLLKYMLTDEKNFVVSPLMSLCSVGAIALGTNGSTRDELTKATMNVVAGNNSDEAKLMDRIKIIFTSILKDKLDYTKSPSYLYVSNDFKVSQSYKEFANHYFGVTVNQIAFSDKAVAEINERALNDTENNVKSVIRELAEGIQMLVVNCTFFCGIWSQGFWEKKQIPFHNFDDSTSSVDFMVGYGKFKMGFNDKYRCHIIELPYNIDSTKMVILMPEQKVDFKIFLGTTSSVTEFTNLISETQLTFTDAQVWLPKFRTEFLVSLKPFYRSIGVDEAFDSTKADFSRTVEPGMASNGLFLGELVEKIVFEVKKEGKRTFRAAELPYNEIFKCNRSFLFFVLTEYKHNQVILLQGAIRLL
ncbi:serpin B11-like isoform X2 [Leptotrombidium deliense]|uniref:Serpin B11-like isoform X2 n=1 Tax=Leptotrombidium deliense TaxID=299467 RepID=A0A443SHP5_9ACAR|nr:serpin B11-like isoform X2 [Leptotrombidium deliense]